jgi:hypothetical protein
VSQFLSRWFCRPMTLPENEQIRRDYRRILDQRADIGVARMASTWLFEPSNIFDPNSRRKPKPEILIVLSYVLLMAAAWAAFNLR